MNWQRTYSEKKSSNSITKVNKIDLDDYLIDDDDNTVHKKTLF